MHDLYRQYRTWLDSLPAAYRILVMVYAVPLAIPVLIAAASLILFAVAAILLILGAIVRLGGAL